MAQGQQPMPDAETVPAEIGQTKVVSYWLHDEGIQTDDYKELEEQLQRMQLRLRELEFEVEEKIKPAVDLNRPNTQLQPTLDRLDTIENDLKNQGQSLSGVLDAIPSFVRHSHKTPKMVLTGRIQTDYWAFPYAEETLFPLESGPYWFSPVVGNFPFVGGYGNPQDRFILRRLRLGVKGDIHDNMFYELEADFANDQVPLYRDAYLGFRDTPFLNTVIIGFQKRPYALDQLNSSNQTVFMERSLASQAFNRDNRRLGISSNGLSRDQKFNWRWGVWGQQLSPGTSGYVGDHYQGEFAGRLASTIWYDESSGGRGYFHLGISGSVGALDGRPGNFFGPSVYATRPESQTNRPWYDTGLIWGAKRNGLIGIESVLNVGAFQIVSEYMAAWVNRDSSAPVTNINFDGGYVQASYFLTGEHIPWNRNRGTIGRVQPFENFFLVRDDQDNIQKGWGAWQVAARYSFLDLNHSDIVGGEGDSFTLGVNWHWNSQARLQFNYIRGNIDREYRGFGDFGIIGMRFMIDF